MLPPPDLNIVRLVTLVNLARGKNITFSNESLSVFKISGINLKNDCQFSVYLQFNPRIQLFLPISKVGF